MKTKSNHIASRYQDWEQFLVDIRIQGRYSFTLDEVKGQFQLPYLAIKQGLYRLKKKQQIAQVRQEFYVIIPPEYSKQGMLPAYMFIDDLMKSLDKLYYVALLSAAALYGAAHQQIMEYTVISNTPAPRSIKNKKISISFFSKREWNGDDIIQKKTNMGYVNVSSPELTALDLITYVDKIGFNRVITILEELVPEIKESSLLKTAKRYSNTATIQRLGYILDEILQEKKLANTLFIVLEGRGMSPILLSTKKGKYENVDNKWKVSNNIEIETDL